MFFSVFKSFCFFARMVFFVLLVAGAFCDAECRHIPGKLIRCCTFFTFVGFFEISVSQYFLKLFGSVLCFLLFFSVYVISRGNGFGGADVRIISLSALFLGFFNTAEALLWGCILGLFFEIVRHRLPNTKSDGIPVITFFVVGIILKSVF